MASLSDSREAFDTLIRRIWHSGLKNVFVKTSLTDVLNSLCIQPDVISQTADGRNLRYVHRMLEGGDIYWISNPENSAVDADVSLRKTDLTPIILNPENGQISSASFNDENGRITVHLHLEPNQALFIMLDAEPQIKSPTDPARQSVTLTTEFPAWEITFQPDRGAPDTAITTELKSWTNFDNEEIRYFSGTATYKNRFTLTKKQLLQQHRIILDLGDVKNLAEVFVNDQRVETLWKQPFKADITHYVQPGDNTLTIRVTNLWANRLIGDAQPQTPVKVTYTCLPFYTPDAPLLPSGLLGPVTIKGEK